MSRTWCVWPYLLGTCTLRLYLSIQSFLWVGLRVQCINCANHIYTVVHVQDMVCMALFVRYMYSAAVLHHGNLPAAVFVHTILPVGRTASSVY